MSFFLLAACLVLSVDAVWAPGTVDVDAFKYHAPVVLEDEPQGFVRFKLTEEVVDKLQPSWGDLRLADPQNRIVPYVLRRDTGGFWANSKPVLGVCQAMTVLDDGTQAILVDFGKAVRKNRLNLQDWMKAPWPLRIEGSDDQEGWRSLLEGDYRIQEKMEPDNPLSRWLQLETGEHRWLRIVYAEGKTPVANTFKSPMLADYVPEPDDMGLVFVPLAPTAPVDPADKPYSGRSAFEWKVGCRNLPVVLTQFVIDDPYFSRQFRLDGSDDGKHWSLLLSGTLKRTQWEKHPIDVLLTTKGFVTQARLRLTVEDGDNPPLSIKPPDLWARSGQLCFDASGRKEVTLYFGNTGISAPSYDLAQSVRDMQFGSLHEVRLAALVERPPVPAKAAEKPPEKESPVFLWVMLGVAACVMLAIVLGAMAGMNRKQQEDDNRPGEEE